MSLQSFHLFPSLPLEVRRLIYFFTPAPRVVHIQEATEDKNAFYKEFSTILLNRKLCPSLTHFATYWRRHVPTPPIQQTTFEHVRGTDASPVYQPWPPSAATPEIPMQWLATRPIVAWGLLRKCYLRSAAPIPALLHTCSESRQELIRLGWELAFRTRSTGPRTWFNFSCDVLCLSRADWYWSNPDSYPQLGSGRYFEVGQFHPCDLARVRRLVLKNGGMLISPGRRSARIEEVSELVQLFGHLELLILGEWGMADLADWTNLGPHWAEYSPSAKELWCCLAVEELDALLGLIVADRFRTHLASAGTTAKDLKTHRARHGKNVDYFEHLGMKTEKALTESRDAKIASSALIPMKPWSIPKIRVAHVLPESAAAQILLERQVAWEKFRKMQANWLNALNDTEMPDGPADRRHNLNLVKIRRLSAGWRLYTEYGLFNDVVARSIYSDEHAGPDLISRKGRCVKTWWIHRGGEIKKPGYEIIW